MRRQSGLVTGCLGAALLVLISSVLGAGDPKPTDPSEVVLKSLDAKLFVDGRVTDTRGMFLRYRVQQVKGDWLWIVADCGTRGWCHRRDVIPADQAIAFFSAVIAREPQSARAYRMRGCSHYCALEYRRAIRDASAAIRLDPSFAPAYVDRCYANLEKFDIKGAIVEYQRGDPTRTDIGAIPSVPSLRLAEE